MSAHGPSDLGPPASALTAYRCPVESADSIGTWTLLWVRAAAVAATARPGTFVMVAVPGPGFHLRRPLSVHRVRGESIALLVEDRGEGTHVLSAQRPGDVLVLTGPLGVGFDVESVRLAVLVAGGIGVAPLCFLADELAARGVPALTCAGVRDAAGQASLGLVQLPDLEVIAEDGSTGDAGTVVDLLDRRPTARLAAEEGATLFACGPLAMIVAVRDWAQRHAAPGYASLEAHMACGTGACHGCVVPTRSGPRRVCRDGPVLPLDEVALP